MDDAVNPADNSTVTVLERFAGDGWDVNHRVTDDGNVECGECSTTSKTESWTAGAEHRVEGASDPDDLQMVVGLECPQCSARGAVVVSYGPTGSEKDAEFVKAVDLSGAADPLA